QSPFAEPPRLFLPRDTHLAGVAAFTATEVHVLLVGFRGWRRRRRRRLGPALLRSKVLHGYPLVHAFGPNHIKGGDLARREPFLDFVFGERSGTLTTLREVDHWVSPSR